ncbi:MAG: outer membrane protein assembly factor BamA [Gemmatimonadetes bacterium]|nr:outer membrane protein assembly factor BamA [Gemmatimonadota bacterium]
MRRGFKAVALAAAFLSVLAGTGGRLLAQTPGGPATVIADSIAVRGYQRLLESVILSTAALRTGVTLTYRDLQTAVRRLWATGEYADVRIYAQGNPAAATLIIEVEEQPLVSRIDIRGLEHISAGTVRDTARLAAGQPYSPQKVLAAESLIRTLLAKRGIPFARVERRLEELPGRPTDRVLVLDVSEGQRVTVAQVGVSGNEALSEGDVQGAMDTKAEGFWWFRSGSFDAETLESDLRERLPALYRSQGHLDFTVLHDTLIVDPQTGKARLEVQVDEGPQFRLAGFEIEGNSRFATEDLQSYFQTERGGLLRSLGLGAEAEQGDPVFNQAAFDAATQRVAQLYRNQGYIYAQVEPEIIRRPPAAEGGPPQVVARWNITEGSPAYVRRIAILGNEYTHERVIRDKILMLPGDVYNEDLLLQSYQSISSLGFFEAPLPPPDIQPDPQTGDVSITFQVKEKQTGSVNFGTSVGGYTGVAGFLGYDQPNLFGQAKEGHVRWDFGRYLNNFTLTYTDPALKQSLLSGTVSLFSARDRFITFQSGERRHTGASLRVGFPFPGSLRSRLFVGYSLSRTKYEFREGEDPSLFLRPPATQSQLSFGLVRQTLNHPLFPTTGSRQSLNFDFNGGLLGGDGNFQKPVFESAWYVPVGQLGASGPASRPVRFTLGLTLRAAAVFGDVEDFPFERFWMGGVQFGQQLRGYDETTVTPGGYFPRGSSAISEIDRLGNAYFSMTAEYAMRLMDNLSLSLFYDAGRVWRDPSEIDPSRLFRGAGLGAMLVTPFGPLGLDYAYGFDKDRPGWQLHFRFGQMF